MMIKWCVVVGMWQKRVIIVAAGLRTVVSEKKNIVPRLFLTPSTPPTIVNSMILSSFYTLLKPFEACRLII